MSDLGWHLELLSHDDDPDGWMYAQVRNYNICRCERDRSEIRKHKRNTKCACLRVACSIRSATSHLSCFLASFLGSINQSINQSINRWTDQSIDGPLQDFDSKVWFSTATALSVVRRRVHTREVSSRRRHVHRDLVASEDALFADKGGDNA